MRVELTPALILHRRPWRDTSVLVEAFSREHGRVGLIAKGARRPKARLRGLLEPLAALRLSWSGRGDLYTLIDADPVQRHALVGNALMAGLYASELIMRLTAREDPHALLHDSLADLLAGLEQGAPAVVALRFFERDLLDQIGYGIPLDATSDSGEPVAAEGRYHYHPDTGLRQATDRPDAGDVAIDGRAILGLVQGRFVHRSDVRAARDLMQAAIAPHLGGRELKTVQTARAMQQFNRAGSNDPASGASS